MHIWYGFLQQFSIIYKVLSTEPAFESTSRLPLLHFFNAQPLENIEAPSVVAVGMLICVHGICIEPLTIFPSASFPHSQQFFESDTHACSFLGTKTGVAGSGMSTGFVVGGQIHAASPAAYFSESQGMEFLFAQHLSTFHFP